MAFMARIIDAPRPKSPFAIPDGVGSPELNNSKFWQLCAWLSQRPHAHAPRPRQGSGTEGLRMECRDGGGRIAVGNEPVARARGPNTAQLGFTAIELLITLAVAGVLISLAVPGFAALARSVGLSVAANELLSALYTARSAALLRGLPVAVCLTSDDSTCVTTAGEAAKGWLVFVPDGGTAAVSRPAVVGEVLSRFRLPGRLTVSGSRPAVTFWPVARAGTTGTFDLCDAGVQGAGRSIVVSQTGRPRVAAEAASCA
jgi:type IV fimbrial biogenesis protein FimT